MFDGSVWFVDLEKALKVFHEKLPKVELFNSIEGNIYGDFFITCGKEKYIITHDTWRVYHFNKKENKWEAV